jgi:hypothetical protein
MKEGQSIVAMNDLDFEIIHVVFKANVFNKYHGTFNWIANRNTKDLGYEYLNYYLQNTIALIRITLKMEVNVFLS